MKKVTYLILILSFVAMTGLVYAQDYGKPAATAAAPAAVATVAAPAAVETVTVKGDIIDNMCAGSQQPETLAAFVAGHTKECAIKCMASGYSIFADGKLSKFDVASNAKVGAFLNTTDSKLKVEVVAKKVGDELSLVSIKNQ